MNSPTTLPLRLLGLASLIGSSFGCVYGLLMSSLSQLSKDDFTSAMNTSPLSEQIIQQDPTIVDRVIALCSVGSYYALFNVLAIVGVAMLMTQRQNGFHLYAAAQIGQAGGFCIAQGIEFSLTYILWNALWIFLFHKACKSLPDQAEQNN